MIHAQHKLQLLLAGRQGLCITMQQELPDYPKTVAISHDSPAVPLVGVLSALVEKRDQGRHYFMALWYQKIPQPDRFFVLAYHRPWLWAKLCEQLGADDIQWLEANWLHHEARFNKHAIDSNDIDPNGRSLGGQSWLAAALHAYYLVKNEGAARADLKDPYAEVAVNALLMLGASPVSDTKPVWWHWLRVQDEPNDAVAFEEQSVILPRLLWALIEHHGLEHRYDGKTLLMNAVEMNKPGVVHQLLMYGADVDACVVGRGRKSASGKGVSDMLPLDANTALQTRLALCHYHAGRKKRHRTGWAVVGFVFFAVFSMSVAYGVWSYFDASQMLFGSEVALGLTLLLAAIVALVFTTVGVMKSISAHRCVGSQVAAINRLNTTVAQLPQPCRQQDAPVAAAVLSETQAAVPDEVAASRGGVVPVQSMRDLLQPDEMAKLQAMQAEIDRAADGPSSLPA